MNGLNNSDKAARERMAMAERASLRRQEAAGADAQGNPLPRRPRRYKLYDRIKDKVSLTAINVIITVTALLLVAALIIGIATGTPR